METEQIPERLKSTNQLGSEDFQDLIYFLDNIFQEDYKQVESKYHQRAKFLFTSFQELKVMKSEMKEILVRFRNTHKRTTWMPADFIEIWREV